jgi:hypothetical protein
MTLWTGVPPAVRTKVTPDEGLDIAGMERSFSLRVEAGAQATRPALPAH